MADGPDAMPPSAAKKYMACTAVGKSTNVVPVATTTTATIARATTRGKHDDDDDDDDDDHDDDDDYEVDYDAIRIERCSRC